MKKVFAIIKKALKTLGSLRTMALACAIASWMGEEVDLWLLEIAVLCIGFDQICDAIKSNHIASLLRDMKPNHKATIEAYYEEKENQQGNA